MMASRCAHKACLALQRLVLLSREGLRRAARSNKDVQAVQGCACAWLQEEEDYALGQRGAYSFAVRLLLSPCWAVLGSLLMHSTVNSGGAR